MDFVVREIQDNNVARLRALRPALVVAEATGGFEHAAIAALAAVGLPVVVATPRQVRDFARATGQLAKTDQLDAGILALFAERVRPDHVCLVPEKREEITTEGGLNVAGNERAVGGVVKRLKKAGIIVSIFIDPDEPQIKAAGSAGADFIESPVFKLLLTSSLLARPFTESIGPDRDLTLPEWRCLIALNARGGLSNIEVSELTGLDEMTVSRALDRLRRNAGKAEWLSPEA